MDTTEITAPSASLDDAAQRITALLSPTEDPQPATTQTEQPPEKVAEQSPPAPDPAKESASEEAEAEQETPDDPPPAPRTLKVKTPEGEQEITEDEAIKGYLRNSDYTRKTQALAEEKRKFEAEEAQQIRAVRTQYAEQLTQVQDVLVALNPANPDWEQRAREVTPEVLQAEVVQWQNAQKAIKQVEAERSKIREQEQADATRGFQQYVELERAKLEEAIPDFRDEAKAKPLRESLKTFGAERYGFSADEFGAVTDSRLVRLLHDAMQYHQQKAKAPAVANKIEKVLETSTPGSTATGSRRTEAMKLKDHAIQSGKVEDAGAAITALLRKKTA